MGNVNIHNQIQAGGEASNLQNCVLGHLEQSLLRGETAAHKNGGAENYIFSFIASALAKKSTPTYLFTPS